MDRLQARVGGDAGEDGGPDDIPYQSKGQPSGDEKRAAQEGQPAKIPQKERDHEHRLQGADAAAGFVDADGPGGQANEIALAEGGNIQPAQQLHRERGDIAHERLRKPEIEALRPGDGRKQKAERKKKPSRPAQAAGAAEVQERDERNRKGQRPIRARPIRRRFLVSR